VTPPNFLKSKYHCDTVRNAGQEKNSEGAVDDGICETENETDGC